MTGRSLQQLAAKFKHTSMTSILVKGARFFYKQEGDCAYFICVVPLQHKDQCLALTRMGREKITAIMAHEVITKSQALDILKDDEKKLKSFDSSTKDKKLCFVICDVKKRDFNGKLPR